jgi:hypothetical protein
MQRLLSLALSALVCLCASTPAGACRFSPPLNPDDVSYADLVVVGRISHYRIVRDMEFRRKMLANPKLPADMRKFYEGPGTLLPDYARFDVEIDEVLLGKAPRRITVTWDNSTFGEPEKMAPGPYLIALRRASSAMPPLRGPSATIMPNPEPDKLAVLQAPCAPAFILETSRDEAGKVRAILRGHRR